jgi:hypothetical protein
MQFDLVAAFSANRLRAMIYALLSDLCGLERFPSKTG